jgi:hypothetical protein
MMDWSGFMQAHNITFSPLSLFVIGWLFRIEKIVQAVRFDAIERKTLLASVADDIRDIKTRQRGRI